MSNFEYKGTKISLDSNGEFTAKINSEFITKASLAALKKKIDASKTFEPFDALYKSNYIHGIFSGRVVGISQAQGKKSYHNCAKWQMEGGDCHRLVLRATPENLALQNTVEQLEKEYLEAKEKLEEHYLPLIKTAVDLVPWEEVQQ